MRSLGAAALLLVALALPVGAKAADAYLALETSGPYHYGDTITVVAHGKYPGHPGDYQAKTTIKMDCRQPGHDDVAFDIVYSEFIHSPGVDQQYTLYLGPNDPNVGTSLWDFFGGGPADCIIEFYRHQPRTTYTILTIHVEA